MWKCHAEEFWEYQFTDFDRKLYIDLLFFYF